MSYIDVFVIPVPSTRREDYRAHEAHWWPEFQKLGATSLVVAWGDDVPEGKQTDFQRSVALEPGETVAVAWMIWPDKATRSAAYAKMMEEMDQATNPIEFPYDMKRMIFGGFEPLLMEGPAR